MCQAWEGGTDCHSDIHHHIYELKCEDELQVCTYLETLERMQEQLMGMGVGVPNTDLVMVILGSLPKLYQPLINAILMSATHTKKSPSYQRKSLKTCWMDGH